MVLAIWNIISMIKKAGRIIELIDLNLGEVVCLLQGKKGATGTEYLWRGLTTNIREANIHDKHSPRAVYYVIGAEERKYIMAMRVFSLDALAQKKKKTSLRKAKCNFVELKKKLVFGNSLNSMLAPKEFFEPENTESTDKAFNLALHSGSIDAIGRITKLRGISVAAALHHSSRIG